MVTIKEVKKEQEEKVKLFTDLWYKRNPVHDLNASSGEDMFWGTAMIVAEEYVEAISEREPSLSCNVCGGKLVYIRGRYPHEEKRCVCPTCDHERLEQINEISDKNYGITNKKQR